MLRPGDARVAVNLGAILGRRLGLLDLPLRRTAHANAVLGLPESLREVSRLQVTPRPKSAA
jgi:hypothetical protein